MRGIDACKRPLSDFGKYLAILGSFKEGSSFDPLKAIRSEFSLLNHLSFGFLVTEFNDLLTSYLTERTDLHVLSRPNQAVVTGTLKQWRIASIECCQQDKPHELRLFFDHIVLTFTRLKLGDLWFDYRRTAHEDQTFFLEHV